MCGIALIAVVTLLGTGGVGARAKAPVSPQAASAKHKRALTVDVRFGGGAIFPWDAMSETGNVFQGGIGVSFGAFRVGLHSAGVLPDSRSQGLFATLWTEFEWRMARFFGRLEPYMVVGLGLAFPDEAEAPRLGDPVPLRWSEKHWFLGMLGLGVRYGTKRGLFLAADFRAYNHTHGGLNLAVGVGF